MAGVELVGLAELLNRPSWHADAACRNHDTSLWFPAVGEPTAPAKAICAGCPVQGDCQEYAAGLEDVPAGVWAGESFRGRKKARRIA